MIQFTYMPEVWWLTGGALAAAVVVLLSYLWAKGREARFLRITLAGVRWIIILAVGIFLFDPEWIEAIKHRQRSRFAVLLDTSRSMNTKDVPQGRLEAAKTWLLNQIGNLGSADVVLEPYSFSQSLVPLSSIEAAKAAGDATGLAVAL